MARLAIVEQSEDGQKTATFLAFVRLYAICMCFCMLLLLFNYLHYNELLHLEHRFDHHLSKWRLQIGSILGSKSGNDQELNTACLEIRKRCRIGKLEEMAEVNGIFPR